MIIPEKFKNGCARVGFALILIFLFRIITDFASERVMLALYDLMIDPAEEIPDLTLISFITQLVSILILYGGCMLATVWALDFKKGDLNGLYKKPQRLGKAVSWAVPCYGAGQAINLIVITLSFTVFSDINALQNGYSPLISSGTSNGVLSMIFMVFQMSIMAPILEELWFRGIIQTKLSDCGHGFAIMASALCFALAHGNIQQFCYTFVMGIFLGYVRYASGSLVPTTIMHMIINSVASIVLVMVSNDTFISAMTKTRMGIPLDDGESALMTAVGVYIIIIIIMMIVGIFAAFGKLKSRRLYRPVNNYPALTKGQKLGALLKAPEFLVGIILCVVYMTGLWSWLIFQLLG
ncbi:MAG: CPBP family intramembrane metalloprotease [Eubacterium sp.]|nr:CPBP family intramembrane metalloprotease [Eubacterium sp.]